MSLRGGGSDNITVGTKVAVDTHSVNAPNHPEHDTLPAYSGTSQTKRPNHATPQIMGSSRAVQEAVSSNPSVTPQIVESAEVINHIRQDNPPSHKSYLIARYTRYNLPSQATTSSACIASLPVLKECKISKGNLFHMRIS
jgi:predicted glutamine amidotransferase